MKLKIFTIGLLATLVMISTNIEAMQWQKKQAEAVKEVPLLRAQIAGGGPAHPDLDVVTHGDNVAAVDDLHAKLGVSAVPSGASANHRITDLQTTLGHAVGGAAHAANQRAETALAQLQPLPLGVDIHTAINHINTDLGPVRITASRRGLGAAPVAAVQGNIHEKLTAVLARLKAGLAATAGAGVHVRTVAQTKTTHTPAATPVVAGDEAAAAAAADIENFLAEIGW